MMALGGVLAIMDKRYRIHTRKADAAEPQLMEKSA
jgi:hypothetical protein